MTFGVKKILLNLAASVAIILAGFLCLWLDTFLPFALPPMPDVVSWVLIIAGLAMIALAETAFLARGGSTGAPADPTRRLVVSGIYRWMRNPIYSGGTLVLLGVALSRNSPTIFLAAVLFPIIMNFAVIPSEERRLERDFGKEYTEYKSKVPRWIPHLRK
jgi:protein-S-isoprenylcysteine O-methyltransferase Ste14